MNRLREGLRQNERAMTDDYTAFLAAVLNLVVLRRERLDALPLPDPDLRAVVEDLEIEYRVLVDTTTAADKAEIGEFYREALRAFGSNEEIFTQYPDVAGLLLTLRIEGARRRVMEVLRRQIGRQPDSHLSREQNCTASGHVTVSVSGASTFFSRYHTSRYSRCAA